MITSRGVVCNSVCMFMCREGAAEEEENAIRGECIDARDITPVSVENTDRLVSSWKRPEIECGRAMSCFDIIDVVRRVTLV